MALDTPLNSRYRTIYAVDERPAGRVLRCRDEQTGRLVLVAELPAATQEDQGALAQLAAQLAGLQSEVLLPLTDHFATPGHYYLVCDDPGGQDLDRALRMRGGPLPEADTARQVQRLLVALEQLHQQRPPLFLGEPLASDVWLSDQGAWMLAPFTLARAIGVGPTPYRAPELGAQGAEPTPTSDVYAAGAIAYHALTGWAPPAAEQIKAGTPLNPPRTLNPQLAPLVEQAIMRALEQRPQNRYQTAREMRVALETAQVMATRPSAFAIDSHAAGPELPPSPLAPPPLVVPAATAPAAAPAPMPAPAKGGMSVGCIVALVLALAAVMVVACIAAALIFTPMGRSVGLAGQPGLASAAPTPVISSSTAEPAAEPTEAATAAPEVSSPPAPTPEPIALGPDAITIDSVKTITQTREITTSQLGPVAYSPDGKLFAFSVERTVSVKDASALSDDVASFSGMRGKVTAIAWSADSELLAVGASDDNDIRVFSMKTRALVATLSGHTGWIRSLAFAPSGSTLASGSIDLTVRLWDARAGTALQTLKGYNDWVGGVAFSPDGTRLASGSRDGSVKMWDVASGAEVSGFSFQAGLAAPGQRYWTTSVLFSPDGKTLAVGAMDSVVYLLDSASGAIVRQLTGHTSPVVIRGLAFAPDGKKLYSSGFDGSIRVWDVAAGAELAVLDQHQLQVFSIAITPDGKQLASASDQEGRLLVWDLDTEQVRGELQIGQGVVTSFAFTPNSRAIGLAGFNGTLVFQSVDDVAESRPFAGSGVARLPLSFISDTAFVAITDQGTVTVVTAGETTRRDLAGFSGRPLAVATSRDGKLIAAAGDSGTVVLWDSATGKVVAQLKTELAAVPLLAFSYDGSMLAAAGAATAPAIEVWDLRQQKRTRSLTGPANQINSLAFQPGGRLLAATSLDGVLRLWDADTGDLIRSTNADPSQRAFTSVSFSPDGTMLATGSLSGAMQIWEASSGTQLAELSLPGNVLAVGFSPDGRTIAASVFDGTVRLFRRPGQ